MFCAYSCEKLQTFYTIIQKRVKTKFTPQYKSIYTAVQNNLNCGVNVSKPQFKNLCSASPINRKFMHRKIVANRNLLSIGYNRKKSYLL